MSDTSKKHDSHCQRLSDLLEPLNDPSHLLEGDRQFVEQHLASCHLCRCERQLLQHIHAQWPPPADQLPAPEPQVRYRLRAAVRSRQRRTFTERALEWLRFPVPAYGIALIALVLAGVTATHNDHSGPQVTFDNAPGRYQ